MFGKRCALKKKIRTSGAVRDQGGEEVENKKKQCKLNQIILNQMYEIKFY